jgi:(p)ppGpp synthase/HD superfamily hydrolase
MILTKDATVLENSILGKMPPTPLIVDMTQEAIRVAKKHLSEVKRPHSEDTVYLHSLRVANRVADYVTKTTQKIFFDYELVIVAILHDIMEHSTYSKEELDKDLKTFVKAPDNSTINLIERVSKDSVKEGELGSTKYAFYHLAQCFKEGDKPFVIKLVEKLDNIHSLIVDESEETEVKTLSKEKYFLSCLYSCKELSKRDMASAGEVYELFNGILKELNKVKF